MAILKLHATNLEVNRQTTPYSELSTSSDAAATSSVVLNSVGFKTGYWLLFGEMSGEKSEMVVLNTITGSTLGHDATEFAHASSTPIYCVPYNQIKFYRKRSGAETLLGAVDMQVGSSKYSTDFYGEAQVGDEFATSYYNSETGAETQKSEWLNMNGYASNSKYGMAIRAAMLFQDKENTVIEDEDWYHWEHEAIGQLTRKAQDKDQGWMLVGPTVITDATEASDNSYTTFTQPAACRVVKQVRVKYSGDYSQAYPENIQDSDACSESQPVWSFDGDDIMVRPGRATAIELRYYPVVSELSDNAETPARPVSDYDHTIVNYMLMRAFAYARNEEMIGYYKQLWQEGVTEMLDELDKRQRDRPKRVMHPNPILAATRDSGGYI